MKGLMPQYDKAEARKCSCYASHNETGCWCDCHPLGARWAEARRLRLAALEPKEEVRG